MGPAADSDNGAMTSGYPNSSDRWWAGARHTLPLLLLAMEAATLIPWSHIAGLLLLPSVARTPVGARTGLPPLVPDMLLIFALGAAWGVRRLTVVRRSPDDRRDWGRRIGTAIAIGSVGGVALLSLHLHGGPPTSAPSGWFGQLTSGHEPGALLCTIAFIGATWWRGTSVGATSPGDRQSGFRSVVVGASISVASAVAAGVVPSILDGVVPVAAIVAIPSMIGALALASLEESQLPRARGASVTTPDRSWLGLIAVLCVGVGTTGTVVALVLGGQASVVILALRAIGGVVGAAIILIASVAIIPVLWFAEWLAGMMRSSGELPPDLPLSGLGRQAFVERFENVDPEPLLDAAVTEIGLAVATLGVVSLVIWRLMRPSAPSDLDGAESEERTSVFSWASIMTRRRPTRDADTNGGNVDGVRLAYRSFLEAMAQRGVGRTSAETPDQFALRSRGADATRDAADARSADIDSLTRAYNEVRYGETDPTRHVPAAAEAARRLAAQS